MKRTFAYLLSDETNQPTLYEVISRHEDHWMGLVTLKDLNQPHIRIIEEESEIWEICTF